MKDDGSGLPENMSESEGMGLRIMQYRARIMDGTLSITNAEGGGALVTCTALVREKS